MWLKNYWTYPLSNIPFLRPLGLVAIISRIFIFWMKYLLHSLGF